MPKKLQRSTWFFLLIIFGAALLLIAIYFGVEPNKNKNENNNSNSVQTVNATNQTAEGVNTQEEPVNARNPLAPWDSPVVVMNDDVIDYAEAEGIAVETFESGGIVTIAPADMEGIMRESVSVVSETPCKVSGLDGTRVEAKNAKDGGPVFLIWVKKGDKIYEFKGTEGWLDSLEKVVIN